MKLRPVCVEDVGQAIAMLLHQEQNGPVVFEFGGPHVYSYEGLLGTVAVQPVQSAS